MRPLLCVVSFFLLIWGVAYGKNPECVGVYYANSIPIEMFYAFDWLILDPDSAKETFTNKRLMIQGGKAKLFGYLSVGEVEPFREDFEEVDKSWLLGENKAWNTYIADIRKEEYQQFLISRAKRIESLGFDGFFLDTLDSYKLVLNQEEWRSYEISLAEFIKRLKKDFPDRLIILNRGFEIYDEVKDYINGVLVEGLYSTVKLKGSGYVEVNEGRDWLLGVLEKIKQNHPVIVLDYADLPEDKKNAKELLSKISSYGFIPYVSVKELNVIGVSPCTPLPRRALLLFNSKDNPTAVDPYWTNLNRLVQPYLEYYGMAVDTWDLSKGLTSFPIWDRYALVVYWNSSYSNQTKLEKWILDNISFGVKFLFIDSFPSYNPAFLSKLGISVKQTVSKEEFKLEYKDKMLGFEIEPSVSFTTVVTPKDAQPLLVYVKGKERHIPIAYTGWGGYALEGTYIRTLTEDLFVVNPFEFFRNLLKDFFPPFALDPVTTENGKRILTIHIDGDGFNQKTEVKGYTYAAEALLNEIFKKYPLAHTIGLIEAEVAPHGAYPNDPHERLEEIARQIYKLPHIKPATHTFTHPFDWYQVEVNGEGYNLKVPNYTFNLEREIKGSAEYINKLADPKKVEIVLWSGQCNPSPHTLKYAYTIGFYNINGGNTMINKKRPFLSYISPTGVDREDYYQIYSPFANENNYTNLWRGPFYGFMDVIDTFKMTDKPYRIKPIGIYYHIYSASKVASLEALKKIYNWALSQEVAPIYIEDYIKKVLDFRNTAIIPMDDGRFRIKNGGFLKTIRVEQDTDIDLSKSRGVLGYNKINNSWYVHLDGSGNYILALGSPHVSYLIDSNAVTAKRLSVSGSNTIKKWW